jgi:hypothetical protein
MTTHCVGRQNQSQLLILYNWRFTVNLFVLAPSPLRPTTGIFFRLNTWSYSPYVKFSLTRGWVCRSQLMLVLASAVILGCESRGIHDRILLSQILDAPNLDGQVPVFINPGTLFLSRRLQRLARLRRRYSIPPPRGVCVSRMQRFYIHNFISYLTGNTLCLRCKAQPVMLFGEKIAVYCANHTEYVNTLCIKCSLCILKNVVHVITTVL